MTNLDSHMEEFSRFIDQAGMDRKDYQYDGVKWCINNELRDEPPFKVRGGFIADEMGLGKTILMLGTLISNPLKSTLIVLPPILIDQWVSQITLTTPFSPLVYHGPKKNTITLQMLLTSPIVITSYGGITLNKEQLDGKQEYPLLYQVSWNRIIFDESHHMRNAKTRVHMSALRLKGDIRWLVSGTPVQNSKQDLYSLCDLIKLPHSFYTNNDNLKLLARSFILKRTKKQVGILIQDLNLHNNQINWTNQREMDLSQEIHAHLEFSNVHSNKSGKITDVFDQIYSGRGAKLALLLKAKQSCILPHLIYSSILKYQHGVDTSDYNEAFSQSSKIDFIIQTILERKENGAGKIIFCNFREEIDLFQKRLQDSGIIVAVIDGRVSKHSRLQILKDPYQVLILQIQTGCEGLNLQEFYSEIYFVSPTWNPAVEDQAIARCHRIGQTKPVNVFRFFMSSFVKDVDDDNLIESVTVETYTNGVQHLKRDIASTFV
jgi:SNF2 family DNA or RNA helicase